MALETAANLAELGTKTIDLFKSVKNKLVNQPEAANGKLEIVFDELSRIFIGFDGEITNFLSMSFEPGTNLKDERKILYRLDGLELNVRLNEARGHCGKIKRIYDKYLDKWLSRVLSPDESGDMATLFENLENSDQGMLDAIYATGNWLSEKAKEILDLLDENKLEEISQRMIKYKNEIRPIRTALSKTTNELHLPANEFAAVSGAV